MKPVKILKRKYLFALQGIFFFLLLAGSLYILNMNKQMYALNAEPRAHTRQLQVLLFVLIFLNIIVFIIYCIDFIKNKYIRVILYIVTGAAIAYSSLWIILLGASSAALQDKKVKVEGQEMIETHSHNIRDGEEYVNYYYPVNSFYKTRFGEPLEQFLERLEEQYGMEFTGNALSSDGYQTTYRVISKNYPDIMCEYSNSYYAIPDPSYIYHNEIVRAQIRKYIDDNNLSWTVAEYSPDVNLVEDEKTAAALYGLCSYLRNDMPIDSYDYELGISAYGRIFDIRIGNDVKYQYTQEDIEMLLETHWSELR